MEIIINGSNWVAIKDNDVSAFGSGLIELAEYLIQLESAQVKKVLLQVNGNTRLLQDSQIQKYFFAIINLFIENN